MCRNWRLQPFRKVMILVSAAHTGRQPPTHPHTHTLTHKHRRSSLTFHLLGKTHLVVSLAWGLSCGSYFYSFPPHYLYHQCHRSVTGVTPVTIIEALIGLIQWRKCLSDSGYSLPVSMQARAQVDVVSMASEPGGFLLSCWRTSASVCNPWFHQLLPYVEEPRKGSTIVYTRWPAACYYCPYSIGSGWFERRLTPILVAVPVVVVLSPYNIKSLTDTPSAKSSRFKSAGC